MKRIIIVIFVMLAVALGTLAWINRDSWFEGASKPLQLYGNIDDRQVNLPFRVSERIAKVLVEEGSQVKQGELLAELETVRLENDLRVAEAALQSTRAALEKAVNGPRSEEIAMARAETAAIEARIKAARNEYQRQQALLKTNAASIKVEESAEADYLLLQALLDRAQSNLAMLVAGTRKEEIELAKAEVAKAEANVAIRRQALDDAQLRAPCDGIVRNRVLEPGEIATPATAAMVIAMTSPKWVRVYLTEPLLPKVKIGEPAEIRFDGMPDRKFEGWVGYLSPTAEFTPKNVESAELRTALVYEARVYVKDPEGVLKLGAPATVVFPGVGNQ